MARTSWYSNHPPSCTCYRCNEARVRRSARGRGRGISRKPLVWLAIALVVGAAVAGTVLFTVG